MSSTHALAGSAPRPPMLSPLLWLCLAATWLVWGSTYLAIKFALLSFPPFFQMGTRFLFAGVVLMAWMRWRGAAWPTRLQWRNALVIGTLMLGGGMGGTALAEVSVGSGLVVAFIAVVPLMIAALNRLWGVVPGRLELAGIVVGLAGVLMLTQGAGFQASPAGLAAIAVACVTWSVGSVLSQRSLPLAPGAMGFASEMICGGVVLLVLSLLHGETPQWPAPASRCKSDRRLPANMRKAPGLASRCKCWGCAPAPVMPWLRPSWPRLPRRRIIRPRDRRPETRDDWDGLDSRGGWLEQD